MKAVYTGNLIDDHGEARIVSFEPFERHDSINKALLGLGYLYDWKRPERKVRVTIETLDDEGESADGDG